MFHEMIFGSDHCMILITTSTEEVIGLRFFKFEEMCTEDPLGDEVVKKCESMVRVAD